MYFACMSIMPTTKSLNMAHGLSIQPWQPFWPSEGVDWPQASDGATKYN